MFEISKAIFCLILYSGQCHWAYQKQFHYLVHLGEFLNFFFTFELLILDGYKYFVFIKIISLSLSNCCFCLIEIKICRNEFIEKKKEVVKIFS